MAKDEREEYIVGLQQQLAKVLAAQDLANSDGGKLLVQLLQADVDKFTAELLSNKFINDHNGYLDARAKANYAASILARVARTADTTKEVELRKEIKTAKGKPKETDDDE